MNKLFLAVLLTASSLLAQAADRVQVTDAWVRATVSNTGTGAFMRLQSAVDTKLVEVRSPVAGVVEVHEMAMLNNVMKMRAVDSLVLPAGKPVDLQPGGYHVMLMDLNAPLQAGQTVPLILVFESKDGQRSTQEVQVPVRALGAMNHSH